LLVEEEGRMPDNNSGDTPSSGLATLPAGDQAAATGANGAAPKPAADTAAGELRKLGSLLRNAGADGAADRVGRAIAKLADGSRDLEDLEREIDPDRAIDELNSARGRMRVRRLIKGDWTGGLRPLLGFPKCVRLAHVLRNLAALVPLIFTWYMLGNAAQQYQAELHQAAIDKDTTTLTEPFLLLWQQGFGTHSLSFQRVTLIDFILLALVLALTAWVHWAEGQADRSADVVYQAVDSFKAAFGPSAIVTEVSAQDWPQRASKVLEEANERTRLLTENAERTITAVTAAATLAVEAASSRLEETRDANQQFLDRFSTEVLRTLANVRKDNEDFINKAVEANQRTLQDLVREQMRPLLTELSNVVAQFKAEQAKYANAVTELAQGVGVIQGAAVDLAASAGTFNGSTQSIAGSLATMASSQQQFANQVEGSARSMSTAAEAMTNVQHTLRTDLHDRLMEMTGNITSASASLTAAQDSLAATATALSTSAMQLGMSATQLKDATMSTVSVLRQAAPAMMSSRRWWHRLPWARRNEHGGR
jgi:hypothetical protein